MSKGRYSCPCHTMSGVRHLIPCCSLPLSQTRTAIANPVTRDRFIAIFQEAGVDKEWAEIVYKRSIKAKAKLDEKSVREAAKGWAEDNGF